jgi:carbamoyltransferase
MNFKIVVPFWLGINSNENESRLKNLKFVNNNLTDLVAFLRNKDIDIDYEIYDFSIKPIEGFEKITHIPFGKEGEFRKTEKLNICISKTKEDIFVGWDADVIIKNSDFEHFYNVLKDFKINEYYNSFNVKAIDTTQEFIDYINYNTELLEDLNGHLYHTDTLSLGGLFVIPTEYLRLDGGYNEKITHRGDEDGELHDRLFQKFKINRNAIYTFYGYHLPHIYDFFNPLYQKIKMPNISIHGSHNAAIALENDGEILEVIEIERFLNVKNAGLTQYITSPSRHFVVQNILKYIEKKYGFKEFGICLYSNTDVMEDGIRIDISTYIPARKYISCLHHEIHAASTFYQSDDKEALIVSFDGGGSDGLFNIYHATRNNGIELVNKHYLDLGFPYMIFGEYVADIKKEIDLARGNLVYAGKLMGLSSYGVVREEWIDSFKEFYRYKIDGSNYPEQLQILGDKIGVTFDKGQQLKGQTAWDVVTTSQRVFEDIFYEVVNPYLEKYPLIPLHLSGGCSLNILLNTRLKQELNRKVFISPNSNDCGLAVGMILNHLKPIYPVDITYKGVGILDEYTLMEYVDEYVCTLYKQEELVNDLVEGKIVGVIRDGAEHGPRALGNRSIICNPTFPNMKDILNAKVKNREWYRPFAPVVRLEDVSKYFEFEGESRWMSFCPQVKEEWKEKLPSITHIDGTARVQTVTKEQNPWLYDLITDFEKISGIGVLLNTSFNIAGKPITSTYRDAVWLYESSQMDRLLLQDFYFKVKFNKYRR